MPSSRFLILFLFVTTLRQCRGDLVKIKEFLKAYNKEGDELQRNDTLAAWNYEVDMTKENKKETVKMSSVTSKFATENREKAKELIKDVEDDVPKSMVRQLKLITRTASSTSSNISQNVATLESRMTSIYSKASVKKEIDGRLLSFKLNQELLPIMADVSKANIGNLRWAWRSWRDVVGKKIKPLYTEFVEHVNKGARENGFADYGDYWRQEYEEDNLEEIVDGILEDMNGLYKKLHAYTRFHLNKMFGDDIVSKTGPIPTHFLNMWGQSWNHLYKHLIPYPQKHIPDVTSEMNKKGWKNVDLLKLAESFFVSIGLDKMPESFFEKSLINRPEGKKPVCHPSSWDIGQGDVRLKMPCMGVSQNDLITVHHEMGHIEYYLMYQNQPVEFRTGANPGFHEAVGDTIALSVMIPEHLESIGLLQESTGDKEESINFLLRQALQRVAFIPFAYIVDKWRWSVFSGKTSPSEYNTYWWELRNKYQGISQPQNMTRNEEDLCDAGTFFHVAHNTEYLRYFLSHILQFQFHKALCDEAGIGKPYHECSIHNSKKAGKKLRNMLELGKELPWRDALEVLTGSTKLSSKPLLEYFQPLEDWLDSYREKNGYELGWEE